MGRQYCCPIQKHPQKVPPRRLQRVKALIIPEEYDEGLDDVRMTPEDFFSILLVENDGFPAIHQYPSLNMAAHRAGQHNLF